SKPMQNSVTDRSLSIVFGTPTVGKPASCSFAATLSVSSPPMGTSASTAWCRKVSITRAIPSFSLAGFVREVPRMVPPIGRMPRTSAGVSSSMRPSSRQPAQPFLTPLTWCPSWNARRATARIAALSPGASPPPVRIPMRTANRLSGLEFFQQLLQADVGEDHLRPPADPAVEHLLGQRPAQPLLEVALRVKSGRGRADDRHPSLERQLLAVSLVDLEPGTVDRLFGVEDEAVEVEDDGSN